MGANCLARGVRPLAAAERTARAAPRARDAGEPARRAWLPIHSSTTRRSGPVDLLGRLPGRAVDQRILDGRRGHPPVRWRSPGRAARVIGGPASSCTPRPTALDTDWHVKLARCRPDGARSTSRRAWSARAGATASTARGSSGPAKSSNTTIRFARRRNRFAGRPPDPARRDQQRLPELRSQPQHRRRRPSVGATSSRKAAVWFGG